MATEQERNRGAGAFSTPGVDTTALQKPFESAASSPVVSFKLQGVEPPSNVYITYDDTISIAVRNSIVGEAVVVNSRILKADGKIQFSSDTLTPTSDRSRNTFILTLPEGYLLGIAFSAIPTVPERGQLFVQALFSHGASANRFATQPLASDYLLSGNYVGWPGGTMRSSLEGPGRVYAVSVGNPAAGVDWAVTVPTGARWRVLSIIGALTTSAAVANRSVAINVTDGGSTVHDAPSGSTQAASLATTYCAAPGMVLAQQGTLMTSFPIFADNRLIAGEVISTSTQNIQVADQWSAIRLLVEEWMEN